MRTWRFAALLLITASCASTSGVAPYGRDSFLVSGQASASLIFSCLAETDLEYQRPNLE